MHPELIDTHAHLDEEAFSADISSVIARAVDAGIGRMLTIGTSAESSRRAVALAQTYECVYAAVGIQPNYVAEAKPGDWKDIEQLAGESKVVAIGETGLDRYWDYAPIELQRDYFSRHIELSRRRSLPFVVHCRDADEDVISQLREASTAGPLSGVMHSFCGTAATARACLELGLHISFSGMLTYKKSEELRSIAGEIPSDRLLIETDAPYLSPAPIEGKRSKRNEPALIVHTAKTLAKARHVAFDDIAAQTTENARKLFRLR